MTIPSFNPAIFQRIAMSRNLYQAKKSFYVLALMVFILTLAVGWLSVILIFKDNITTNNNIMYSLFDIIPPVYKGLLLIGIIAMVMSTVDSYINSSSVLITHDFINVFTKLKNELLTARIVSFILGISGILLSLKDVGIFRLIVLTSSYYMSVVTIPFTMAVIGYRTPYEKAVLYGMASGFLVNTSWIYLDITVIDGVIPAMFTNWIVLVIMHKYYYSKELAKLA
jgi:Na+/proline symporter